MNEWAKEDTYEDEKCNPEGSRWESVCAGLTCVYAILLLLSPHCLTSHPEQHDTLWIQIYSVKKRKRARERKERENNNNNNKKPVDDLSNEFRSLRTWFLYPA